MKLEIGLGCRTHLMGQGDAIYFLWLSKGGRVSTVNRNLEMGNTPSLDLCFVMSLAHGPST
jgi:hypothetical protein